MLISAEKAPWHYILLNGDWDQSSASCRTVGGRATPVARRARLAAGRGGERRRKRLPSCSTSVSVSVSRSARILGMNRCERHRRRGLACRIRRGPLAPLSARGQGSSLMGQSRRFLESGLEGRSGMEDGPEYVHAPSCEGNDGLVVAFTLASLAFVEGSAVVMVERAEGGLVEDAFEPLVAAVGSAQEPGSARLSQHWRHSSGRGECVGGAEAGEIACL